jgi:hypothetical protein
MSAFVLGVERGVYRNARTGNRQPSAEWTVRQPLPYAIYLKYPELVQQPR